MLSVVASFAEAWIEIQLPDLHVGDGESPPSRRRGLKYETYYPKERNDHVASFAEAWIEIMGRV